MPVDLAAGPDGEIVNRYCGICHGVEYVPMQPRLSKAQWTGTVTKMIKVFGAPVPQEDADNSTTVRIEDSLQLAAGSINLL